MSLIDVPKKEFRFAMISDDGDTTISFDLPLDCTWMDIVPYFNQFLAGCGYIAHNCQFVGDECDCE